MTSGVDDSLVTDAVVALLRAELPDGVLVGDGGSPFVAGSVDPLSQVDPDSGEAFPYAIVYAISPDAFPAEGYAGQRDGTMVLRFQVTTVGPQRDAAQALAAVANGILVDRADSDPRDYTHALTVPGHSVMKRERAGKVPNFGEGGYSNAGVLVDVWVHRDS
jgi:hypothetical protein